MSRSEKLDTIVVNVDELLEQLEFMRDDGMTFAVLSIAPPMQDMGEWLPARLDLSAASEEEGAALVEYESIDAADVDPDALGHYPD